MTTPAEYLLVGYPVRLGAVHQEHLDEVLREFQLLALSRPEVKEQVPGRLLELVDVLTTRYGADVEPARRAREQALRRGDDTVDLRYPAVPDAPRLVATWRDVMVEVDEFCRTGDLLSLATPPGVVALRHWVAEEFLRQSDGRPPTPWSGPLQ